MTACVGKTGNSIDVYFSDTDKILYLIKEFGSFKDEQELACIAFIGKILDFDIPIDERKIDVGRNGLSEPSVFMNLLLLERGGYIENTHKTGTIKLKPEGLKYLSKRKQNEMYGDFVERMKQIDRGLWPIISFYILEERQTKSSHKDVLELIEDVFELSVDQLKVLTSFIE